MMNSIVTCNKCSRIHKNLKSLRQKYITYHNNPVDGYGSIKSKLFIVGLAPGLHGANRTSRPFEGDSSGNLLHKCLSDIKAMNNSPYIKPYITNAVKCYPPNNKPLISEITNCSHHLSNEILKTSQKKVILALGKIAHDSIIKITKHKLKLYPFIHSHIYSINDKITLIDSYHCSKLNINTKRLTEKTLQDIILKAMIISRHYDKYKN